MARKSTRVGLWVLVEMVARVVVVMAGLGVSAAPALAQRADGTRAGQVAAPEGRAALEHQLQERAARLRSELERTNTQISSLKKAGPGIRNDFRLHRRQADAEQLARELTAVEAQLRGLRAGPSTRARSPTSDDAEAPAALEARADLLSDEARRLGEKASGMARTAGELRSRQVLVRRAGQIERDPFGGMDGSKRLMVVQAPVRQTGRSAPENGTGASGMPTPPTFAPPRPVDPSAVTPTLGPAGGASTPDSRAAASGARALIDPAATPDLRAGDRAGGKPLTEVERLERAAATLKERAAALESEAQSLRARAAKP